MARKQTQMERDEISNFRRIWPDISQRSAPKMIRERTHMYPNLAARPVATIYGWIRQYDKRNANRMATA